MVAGYRACRGRGTHTCDNLGTPLHAPPPPSAPAAAGRSSGGTSCPAGCFAEKTLSRHSVGTQPATGLTPLCKQSHLISTAPPLCTPTRPAFLRRSRQTPDHHPGLWCGIIILKKYIFHKKKNQEITGAPRQRQHRQGCTYYQVLKGQI